MNRPGSEFPPPTHTHRERERERERELIEHFLHSIILLASFYRSFPCWHLDITWPPKADIMISLTSLLHRSARAYYYKAGPFDVSPGRTRKTPSELNNVSLHFVPHRLHLQRSSRVSGCGMANGPDVYTAIQFNSKPRSYGSEAFIRATPLP